jgi:hypothetical protein
LVSVVNAGPPLPSNNPQPPAGGLITTAGSACATLIPPATSAATATPAKSMFFSITVSPSLLAAIPRVLRGGWRDRKSLGILGQQIGWLEFSVVSGSAVLGLYVTHALDELGEFGAVPFEPTFPGFQMVVWSGSPLRAGHGGSSSSSGSPWLIVRPPCPTRLAACRAS